MVGAFFFVPLPLKFWGGEIYRKLQCWKEHLAWLETLKDRDSVRNYAIREWEARKGVAIAKATVEAYERLYKFQKGINK